MRPLDLRHDAPLACAGTTVTMNGRQYIVSELLASGSKYAVYRLQNERSGLSLHVLKVRLIHPADPMAARAASVATIRGMAELRLEFLRSKGGRPIVPFAWFVDGSGGSFEVHECVGLPPADPDPVAPALLAAREHQKRGEAPAAVVVLREALSAAPDHTVALNNLAAALMEVGDLTGAHDVLCRAVEIEPNFPRYLANLARPSLVNGRSSLAAWYFRRFQQVFPDLHDWDEFGLQIFLAAGQPQRAAALVSTLPLSPAQCEPIAAEVARAISARAEADAMAIQASMALKATPPDQEGCRDLLARARDRYPQSATINFNYAMALRRLGDHSGAVSALGATVSGEPFVDLYCIANAAFCLIELGQWDMAARQLGHVQSLVIARSTPPYTYDLPSVTDWITDEGTITEEQPGVAAALIDRLLKEHPDRAQVTPELVQFGAWYHDAERAFAAASASNSPPDQSPADVPPTATRGWWATLVRWFRGERS